MLCSSPALANVDLPEAQAATRSVSPVADLTRRLAAGEEEAFREFHRRYFDRLYRHLVALTRGQEGEAQEAMQDTLCRMVRHVRRFEDAEVFWCWLLALARSAVRDAGRKRRRYWRLLAEYARQWLQVRPDPADDGDARLDSILENCLAELEPDDRTLLQEKYLSRTPVRDLAARVGVTEKAVESRLFRLRRQLRARLLEKLHEDLR